MTLQRPCHDLKSRQALCCIARLLKLLVAIQFIDTQAVPVAESAWLVSHNILHSCWFALSEAAKGARLDPA